MNYKRLFLYVMFALASIHTAECLAGDGKDDYDFVRNIITLNPENPGALGLALEEADLLSPHWQHMLLRDVVKLWNKTTFATPAVHDYFTFLMLSSLSDQTAGPVPQLFRTYLETLKRTQPSVFKAVRITLLESRTGLRDIFSAIRGSENVEDVQELLALLPLLQPLPDNVEVALWQFIQNPDQDLAAAAARTLLQLDATDEILAARAASYLSNLYTDRPSLERASSIHGLSPAHRARLPLVVRVGAAARRQYARCSDYLQSGLSWMRGER